MSAGTSTKYRCRLFWGNPCTSPPDGQPRIIKTALADTTRGIPEEIREIIDANPDYAPGTGWTIGWECIEQRPIRRWSRAAKARVRQANLRRRIEKKFPLFAADFIAAEIAARPAYFEAAE
ncbi:hypothetical protein RNZ50_15750 [Paracoccaceae bacterium Fryx2]|nr:hypothetical protein [Paracoccaceae bacterium Fryx2]